MAKIALARRPVVGWAPSRAELDAHARETLGSTPARSAPRILIADDDRASREMLLKVVEQWGYPVVLARDGVEALRILASPEPPQIAILDWQMPGFDGLRVCRYIREHRSERYVYVLLLTGLCHREATVEALGAGADDYLTKPFDERELEMRLRAGRRIVELDERLRVAAMRDALTGLWNRGAVGQYLQQQLSRSRREGSGLSVFMIDLDHFKRINDDHGHAAGDDVLRETARRLRGALRCYDGLGRVGGEEFLAVLAEVELPSAHGVAERLRRAVAAGPVESCAGPLSVTASIGVTSCHGAGADADALMARADEALYRAKQAGRDRVESAEFMPAVRSVDRS